MIDGLSPQALHFEFHEDINVDPLATLRRIEAFLEIPPHNYARWLMSRRPTASVAVAMPKFFPEIFAKDMQRIRDELSELGLDAQNRWT